MREYVDFLGSQPPYDQLDAADLEALARLVEVEYFTEGTIIVTAGQAPLSHFYVVRSGEVEVVDRGRVVDVLDTGETFGQISVLSGLPPPLTVRAADDTLCYRFIDPRKYLHHPDRLQFSHYGSLVSRERLRPRRSSIAAGAPPDATRCVVPTGGHCRRGRRRDDRRGSVLRAHPAR